MEIIELSATHSAYLAPLTKWRIMDVPTLMKLYDFRPSYAVVCRVLRELEKRGILQSAKRPGKNQKYVFLTGKGEKLLCCGEAPPAVNSETLLHDLKVSEITRSFLEKGWIHSVHLEHEIRNMRTISTASSLVPDALLEGSKKGTTFKMAFELELNWKSHTRILEKARQYTDQSSYDYVLYLFERPNLMEGYHRLFASCLTSTQLKRLMLFAWNGHDDIESAQGIFKENRMKFGELFA